MFTFTKKYLGYGLGLVALIVGMCMLTSCGDDEPDNNVPGSINAGLPKNLTSCYVELVGTWYCTMQYIEEGGDDPYQETEEYEPSANLSMRFDSDLSGYVRVGGNDNWTSLFEIGNSRSFKWQLSEHDGGYYVETTIFGDEYYRIVSLKDNVLELLWEDEDLKILARFTRQ